jgi:Mrp family chromosome partitioning ATPase
MTEGNCLVGVLRRERKASSIVQIVAASSGEGTSSVARDLALVAARIPGLRVLLLDLNPPGNIQFLALRHRFGVDVAGSRPLPAGPVEGVLHRIAGANLCVSETRPVWKDGEPGWSEAFASLRNDFELVLIDSPPLERSGDAIVLALDVDTNLLVIEAERTRSAAARDLRDRILEVGGVIGGVVLNQRRCHIPDFILRHV